MSIAFTSRMALAQLGEKFGQQAAAVYLFIADWKGELGPTLADIRDGLHLHYSTVSARVKALKDAGAVIEGPFKKNADSGISARTHRVKVYQPATPSTREAAQVDIFADSHAPGIGRRNFA